jgi:hypothetical protein
VKLPLCVKKVLTATLASGPALTMGVTLWTVMSVK